MIINAKYCLIGEEFELAEDVHIEVVDGSIVHIGRGKLSVREALNFNSGVIVPSLINSHIHVFDYAFAEAGRGLSINELVREPDGLKHRLLRTLSKEDLKKAATNVFLLQLSYGVSAVAVFCELGLDGLSIARDASNKLPLRTIMLGRPERIDYLEEIDSIIESSEGLGLSSVLIYSEEFLKLMRRRASGKLIAVHVSETKECHASGDFELAMKYLNPDIIVHGVHLTQDQISQMADRNVSLITCPRSNMWFSVGLPPLVEAIDAGVNVALGTDNAGWINPDLWREMEITWSLIRLKKRFDIEAKDILKMATINAAKSLKMKKTGIINEGYDANFMVLDTDRLNFSSSHDKIAAIVKRGCSNSILASFIRGTEVLHFSYSSIG